MTGTDFYPISILLGIYRETDKTEYSLQISEIAPNTMKMCNFVQQDVIANVLEKDRIDFK